MAYTEPNLVNPMSAFDYILMLMIKITGESMTGPDHYRAAERFLEEAKSGDDSSSRAAWCLGWRSCTWPWPRSLPPL